MGFFRLLKDPIWWLGQAGLTIDFIIYQFAIDSYDISIVKPLVNLNLLFVITFFIGYFT